MFFAELERGGRQCWKKGHSPSAPPKGGSRAGEKCVIYFSSVLQIWQDCGSGPWKPEAAAEGGAERWQMAQAGRSIQATRARSIAPGRRGTGGPHLHSAPPGALDAGGSGTGFGSESEGEGCCYPARGAAVQRGGDKLLQVRASRRGADGSGAGARETGFRVSPRPCPGAHFCCKETTRGRCRLPARGGFFQTRETGGVDPPGELRPPQNSQGSPAHGGAASAGQSVECVDGEGADMPSPENS